LAENFPLFRGVLARRSGASKRRRVSVAPELATGTDRLYGRFRRFGFARESLRSGPGTGASPGMPYAAHCRIPPVKPCHIRTLGVRIVERADLKSATCRTARLPVQLPGNSEASAPVGRGSEKGLSGHRPLSRPDRMDAVALAEHVGCVVRSAGEFVHIEKLRALKRLQDNAFFACTFELPDHRHGIVFNPLMSDARRNSDVAHEVAHILLKHRVVCQKSADPKRE